MKRIFYLGASLALTLTLISGCGSSGGGSADPTPPPTATPSATTAPAPTAAPTAAPAANGALISADQAKAAALSHANIAEADTREMDVEQETENGRSIYDINFKAGTQEYDYDIDAQTGEVIKFDSEIDD